MQILQKYLFMYIYMLKLPAKSIMSNIKTQEFLIKTFQTHNQNFFDNILCESLWTEADTNLPKKWSNNYIKESQMFPVEEFNESKQNWSLIDMIKNVKKKNIMIYSDKKTRLRLQNCMYPVFKALAINADYLCIFLDNRILMNLGVNNLIQFVQNEAKNYNNAHPDLAILHDEQVDFNNFFMQQLRSKRRCFIIIRNFFVNAEYFNSIAELPDFIKVVAIRSHNEPMAYQHNWIQVTIKYIDTSFYHYAIEITLPYLLFFISLFTIAVSTIDFTQYIKNITKYPRLRKKSNLKLLRRLLGISLIGLCCIGIFWLIIDPFEATNISMKILKSYFVAIMFIQMPFTALVALRMIFRQF